MDVTKMDVEKGAELASVNAARRSCCRFRPVLTLFLLVIAGLAGFAYYAHRSTQTVPSFYQAALEVPADSYREAGAEFETQLLQLNTDVRNLSEWQASFSHEQINGWLAFELPENFPGTIPPEISEPRVSFTADKIQLAFRFVSPRFSGIVTASGNIFCTDVPNQIGIQISRLSTGVVPLPISVWADSIKDGCAKAGINLMWSQKDGDTLAIVDLPERFLDIRQRKISLENIQVQDQQVVLSGTSEPLEPTDSTQHSRPFDGFGGESMDSDQAGTSDHRVSDSANENSHR